MANDPHLVVNGLDVSDLTEEYLGMTRAGGADVWHKSMGGYRTFADAYNFVDDHPDDVTIVRTVDDMHRAADEGKVALLFGW